MPAISIVMPLLNPHPLHFPAAIESVLGQTHSDWELIVVEDPSPASAATHLAALNDSRIRHVANPSRTSLVDQLNQGLSLSQAELVARFDADDICERERLEEQYARFQADERLDVLGSQLAIIDGEGAMLGYRAYPLQHDELMSAMRRYNPLAHPSVMFRKALVQAAGGYQYRRFPAEDYELWCRLAAGGARFANHESPLVRYRIDPSAIKVGKIRDMLRGTLDVKRRNWRDDMSPLAYARLLLEESLVAMPPRWALKLFLWSHVRASLPTASQTVLSAAQSR